jgi:purine-binding chemotaxis protein CheW
MTTPAMRSPIEAKLKQRAHKLARRPEVRERGRALGTFAIVSVGGQQLGLPVERLREIVTTPPITALPNLPPWLAGIALVRGGLVCVADLGRLYGLASPAGGRSTAVLIGDAGELGVLVDRVLGFRELRADEVCEGEADPSAHTPVPSRGTTRDLVTLLDMQQLFSDPRLIVDHGPAAARNPSDPAMTKGDKRDGKEDT